MATERSRQEIHQGYDSVIRMLRKIHRAKLNQYGIDRYKEEDKRFALLMCYSDVYRKGIRLRTLTEAVMAGEGVSPGVLKDAYADMANYAIMAVQEIEHHYNEGESSV